MRPLRLLALVQKPPGISPGQRFRLEQWAPHLAAEHAIQLDWAVFESAALSAVLYRPGHTLKKGVAIVADTIRRRRILELSRAYDGVVVYREAAPLGPAFYERLLHRAAVPLLLDFDDAIWIPAVATVNGLFSRLRFASKTASLCRMARAVMTGNAFLAAYARQHARNVHVVPTSVDLSRYTVAPPPTEPSPFVIGWTGSRPTLEHLELARPALERLAQRRAVELLVVCDQPPPAPFAGVRTHFVRWSKEREAAVLSRAHVGIMPLPDDEFSRGKCGLKALQFMASGRAVVSSPVGMSRTLIQSGENGILASSLDEWVDALDSLAASPGLAARLGSAGRKTVEAEYASERCAARFAAAVRSAIA